MYTSTTAANYRCVREIVVESAASAAGERTVLGGLPPANRGMNNGMIYCIRNKNIILFFILLIDRYHVIIYPCPNPRYCCTNVHYILSRPIIIFYVTMVCIHFDLVCLHKSAYSCRRANESALLCPFTNPA